MDRSRRAGAKQSAPPPNLSRLTVKRRPNRRKQGSVWSRLPKPQMLVDACGRALRRSVPGLIGMGVVAALGGSAWASYHFVTTSSRFAIETIEIHGNHQLSTDQIRDMIPARVGDNVFSARLDDIVRELHTSPWVASAEAHRMLPHTIVVELREHVPAALVQLGTFYLVDAEGHPFKRAELATDESAGLPIITGLDRNAYLANPETTAAQVRGALAALAAWTKEEGRPAIGEIHLDAHGALTLVTYEHAISIQLGSAEPAKRMKTFDATWTELTSDERTRVRAIHLDARSDQVTVAFTPKDS